MNNRRDAAIPRESLRRVRDRGGRYLRSLAKIWKHSSVADLQIDVNERLTSTVGRCAKGGVIGLSPAAAARRDRLLYEIISTKRRTALFGNVPATRQDLTALNGASWSKQRDSRP